MRLATIVRIIAYCFLALILAVATYVFMMSGIYHTPNSFLTPASYISPGGKILIVGGTRGTGLETVKLLLDRGEDVTAVVRATSNVDALNALGVKQVVADALDPRSLFAMSCTVDPSRTPRHWRTPKP